MGRRGPAPTPAHLRAIQGNASRRPLPAAGPPVFPLVTTVPEPPAFLDDVARAKWIEVCDVLVPAGVLTVCDLTNVEVYCAAYCRWRAAEEDVLAHGQTLQTARGTVKNPACAVASQALRQMKDFGALLGLDPASRLRLRVEGAARENPFALLMREAD